MNIVFIRHFPVPGNIKKQYIGRTDEMLSDDVIQQFRSGKMTLSPSGYPETEIVISSPMKRCLETARLIYPEIRIRIDERLRECDFGRYEGKTYEELKEEPDYIRWLESGGMTAFPDGESQEEFRSRCEEGVRSEILHLFQMNIETAAFIVHGGTIMAAMDVLAEGKHSFYDWQAPNGGGYTAEAFYDEWSTGIQKLRNIRVLGGKR